MVKKIEGRCSAIEDYVTANEWLVCALLFTSVMEQNKSDQERSRSMAAARRS